MPSPDVGRYVEILFIEAKYFKQDVFWEYADCRRLSASVPCGVPYKVSIRYYSRHGVAAKPTLTTDVPSLLAAALGALPDM